MHTRRSPRCIGPGDGREVMLRALLDANPPQIVRALERLSARSRHHRFMQQETQLDGNAPYRSAAAAGSAA